MRSPCWKKDKIESTRAATLFCISCVRLARAARPYAVEQRSPIAASFGDQNRNKTFAIVLTSEFRRASRSRIELLLC